MSKSNTAIEATLTRTQLKVLQSILPKGFSLKLVEESAAREKTPPSKKKQIKAVK